MITEIQIGKSRAHIGYLRAVLNLMGGKVGMTRKDVEAAEHAVGEICGNSIKGHDESGDIRLSVRLAAEDSCLSLDINDSEADQADACAPDGRYEVLMEQLRRFMDKAEIVRGEQGLTIHVEKRAGAADTVSAGAGRQLAAAGSSNLQV